jgi:hypothetical protein
MSCAAFSAQIPQKPWTEWTKKEVLKILNDSPWGQTQVDTDTSEIVYTPTTQTGGGDSASRREQGATNQATSVTYRIRWLSARPIRAALARQFELEKGAMNEQLRFFAEGPSEKRVVVAVTFESNDQRFGAKVMQAFNSANPGVLKNNTYLERKDGKRIFLQEYVPPQQNPLASAMFIFPRMVDERAMLDEHSGNVRFHSEYDNKTALDPTLSRAQTSNTTRVAGVSNQTESPYKFRLDMKFKAAEMVFNGRLEY